MSRHTDLSTCSILLCLSFLAGFPSTLPAQLQSVRVQVIDRGQADGILIRTPQDTQWVVIDVGGDRLQAEAMEMEWGVDSVDLAITSHRHIDHYGGMDDVLEDFPVGLYLANLEDCPDRVHDGTIRDILEERQIPTQGPRSDTLNVNGVRFIVLPRDPVDDECPDEENDNSIIVRMEFGEFSMFFTGDAETDERKWLMEHHPELLRATVLKASHHGSINGVDGEVDDVSWTGAVSPEAVVISAHINSQHGHPDPEAVQIYEDSVGRADVYCTSRHGTLQVYARQDGGFRIYRQFLRGGSCAFGTPLEEETAALPSLAPVH